MSKKENNTDWDEFINGLDESLKSVDTYSKLKLKHQSEPKPRTPIKKNHSPDGTPWILLGMILIAVLAGIIGIYNGTLPNEDIVDESNSITFTTTSTYQYSPETEPVGYSPLYYEFINMTLYSGNVFYTDGPLQSYSGNLSVNGDCYLAEVNEKYLWNVIIEINCNSTGFSLLSGYNGDSPMYGQEPLIYYPIIYKRTTFFETVLYTHNLDRLFNISISYICLNSTS